MKTIDLSEDDGYVQVKMGGSEPVRLDLYQTQSILDAFWQDQKERNVPDPEAGDALVELLHVRFGLPLVSHKLALAFVEQIYAAVEACKKKDAPCAGPVASTGSTSSL